MTLTLNNLSNKKKARKRVGRGNASGRGTYSTRGLKGQRSRSGGRGGLKLKGFKQTLLSAPKFKGMKSHRPKAQVVKLSILEKKFADNDKITPGTLLEKRLIDKINIPVKILFDKEIKKPFEVFGCLLSKKARTALEKAGGKVVEMEEKPKDDE